MEHAIIYLLIHRAPGPHAGHEGNHLTENLKAFVDEISMRCICEPVPGYNECIRADEERLFCINGKTQHGTLGMYGGSCPVRKNREFKRAYYCPHGSEKDLLQLPENRVNRVRC
jgi:hypothetical protein